MKRFIKKIACLIIITPFAFVIMNYIYFGTLNYLIHTYRIAGEVFYVIDKAEYNSGRETVYIGGSLCNQIWPQNHDSENIAHLGCNNGIMAAGNYLLLKKYLEHNQQTKEVYYLILPESLCYGDYSYPYFVIPFLDSDNIKLLEHETREVLYKKFGKFFVTNSHIKYFFLNNIELMKICLDFIKDKSDKINTSHRLSKTSITYLAKIRELCQEHNVKIFILPLPMADTSKNYGWDEYEQDIIKYGFKDLFGNFVEKIHYYPENWFSDGVHFKPQILDQHREEIADAILR